MNNNTSPKALIRFGFILRPGSRLGEREYNIQSPSGLYATLFRFVNSTHDTLTLRNVYNHISIRPLSLLDSALFYPRLQHLAGWPGASSAAGLYRLYPRPDVGSSPRYRAHEMGN